jgi:malonyl-CoA O-methyltransferase
MTTVFDLDKLKIKQSFSAASSTYDKVAELQRTVGKALLTSVCDNKSAQVIADVGCGTGFVCDELLKSESAGHLQTVIALDIAMPMLQQARRKLLKYDKVQYLCADAEALPITEKSVDTVCSNLALQWCRTPGPLFIEFKRILKPGGQLLFSTFGPQTLRELKSAWSEVDDYCHVNEFFSELQLEQALRDAGFSEIHISTLPYRPTYNSVLDLMRELKALGAHNVTAGRNRKLTTRTQLQDMMTAYKVCRIEDGIPATFSVITVSAKS